MIKNENLKLLPKYEEYIVYVNKMIMSSPKCCRLSIGDELKESMYNCLYQIYRYKKEKQLYKVFRRYRENVRWLVTPR